MSGLTHLRALALGRKPSDDGLLGNARCAWGNGELLSEEAILAAFAARPFDLEADLLCVDSPEGAALIGTQGALFADLYGERIGRMWRVGEEGTMPREQAIDVAFDADMNQERGGLNLRLEDHPYLDPLAAEKLLAAARDLIKHVQDEGRLLRVRGFIVRAFGGPDASAALLSLFTLDNEPRRSATFSYAVIGIGPAPGDVRTVHHHPKPREWTPRF